MNPEVDLLIPVYNGRQFLDSLINEIELNRHFFKEIIFYDDASKDDSALYLAKKNYRVIRGEVNQGQAFARSALLGVARSEYVSFHDMDDPLHESFYRNIIPTLEPKKISIGRNIAVYSNYTIENRIPPSIAGGRLSAHDAYDYFIHLNSVIFPRRLLVSLGGFEPTLRLHEDRFLFLKIAHAEIDWIVCPDACASQNCHTNNTTSTVSQDFYNVNWIKFFELGLELFRDKNLDFIYPDLFRIACNLLRAGDREMARRGFAMCDEFGAEYFFPKGSHLVWVAKMFGLMNTIRIRRLLRIRIRLGD